jgi:hypothetical protein
MDAMFSQILGLSTVLTALYASSSLAVMVERKGER